MRVYFHKNFKKRYRSLNSSERKKWNERLALFMSNAFHPVLYNHALRGEYSGYRSINITGDLRALYEPVGKDTALFITIDTHGNLYRS